MVETVLRNRGTPLEYVASTRGVMKIWFEGHHFKFLFRQGQYSLFQCIFKEKQEVCKVKIVSDQRFVYPYEGEHIHFMKALDKCTTGTTPRYYVEESTIDNNEPQQQMEYFQITTASDATVATALTLNDQSTTIDKKNKARILNQEIVFSNKVFEIVTTEGDIEANEEYIAETETAVVEEDVGDIEDFRDQIRRRLQKALIKKKK